MPKTNKSHWRAAIMAAMEARFEGRKEQTEML